MDHRAWTALLLPLCAIAAGAEDDEARIEVLIRAERSAVAAVSADAPPAAQPQASATAPAPSTQPSAAIAGTAAAPAPETAASQPTRPDAASPGPDTPQELRFDDLKQHLGEVLYIVTTNGAKHFAEIQSANARQVTVRMHQAGGTAMYTLDRKQIAYIETR